MGQYFRIAGMMFLTTVAARAQDSQIPPPSIAPPAPPAKVIPPPSQGSAPLPEPTISTAPSAAPALPPVAAPRKQQPKQQTKQQTKQGVPRQPTRPAVATPIAPSVAAPVTGAAAAVTPPPQGANLSLSRIRIIRMQDFEGQSENQIKLRSSVNGPSATQELTQPGTSFEFKIRPAQGWGIVSIEDAKLVQVISQSGKSLATQPVARASGNPAEATGGGGLAGWVLPVDLSPSEAIIQIRTELPPRADSQLAKLTAEFQLTIGYRQIVRLMDLSKRLGQPIDTGQRDVTLSVDQIERDLVEISAIGQFDKIGEITIVDLNSEKIVPYATELKTVGAPGASQKKVWTLSFSQLPPIIGMTVDVYPVRQQLRPRYDWDNVPLP